MHRQSTEERRAARIAGGEQFLEDTAQPRSTAPREVPHEEVARARAPRKETPAAMSARRSDARRELLAALASRQALRRAILLHEVLGPPKALQPE